MKPAGCEPVMAVSLLTRLLTQGKDNDLLCTGQQTSSFPRAVALQCEIQTGAAAKLHSPRRGGMRPLHAPMAGK
jgi:hypothetical protein